jgi:hypothetical protein
LSRRSPFDKLRAKADPSAVNSWPEKHSAFERRPLASRNARGLERPTAPAEAAGPKKECASEKAASPPAAPQCGGTLGLEMAEIVSAWPKLPPEIRVAILTLLRAANSG